MTAPEMPEGLRPADSDGVGWSRRRAGRGFSYLDEHGHRIADRRVIARIKALAIPPAWENVWICPDPRGHLQAVGTDSRGRRQYRYHDQWRVARDGDKHDRILRFARALPRLRARVDADLGASDLGRDRVLAAAVRLMELGRFRVGGEVYATENDSFGLATVRKEHVRIRGDTIVFDFPAKTGRHIVREVVDDEVLDVVRAMRRRRGGGAELLAYRDDEGAWVDVRSTEINEYVQEAIGPEFSAKDFRTWYATVLAATELALIDEEPARDAARRKVVVEVMRRVADDLGNTPAVARASYVDPRVINAYGDGDTVADTAGRLDANDLEGVLTPELEAAVLGLIRRAQRRAARRSQ